MEFRGGGERLAGVVRERYPFRSPVRGTPFTPQRDIGVAK